MAGRRSRWRWRIRAVGMAAALLAGGRPPAVAQSAPPVLLRIQPRVGDTLRMRLEEEVETTGSTRMGQSDTSITVRESRLLLSRTVVQASDDAGITVLNITDSVALSSTGGRRAALPEEVRRQLQGKRVRMRVSPQGAAYVLDNPDNLSSDLTSLIAQMPATLPASPVAVGDTWSQDMRVPLPGDSRATGSTVHTTFRLDSLGRGGTTAHISVRGVLSRDTAAAPDRGIKLSTTGSISGTIILDRRRGWPIDARTTISMKSLVRPPPNVKAEPMHLRTKITQRLRAM